MAEANRIRHPNKRRFFRMEDLPLYIMALPTIIFLLMFCYAPMFGLVMAFQDFKVDLGFFGSKFVGFQNFKFLFSSTDAWVITRNTVCYNLVFIVVNTSLAIVMSLMLSELHSRGLAKTLQTVYMLPYFLAWTVVAIVLSGFLDRGYGLVNKLIQALGGKGKTDWYKERELWPWLFVALNAWKGVGYSTVLYLAVISGISNDYYEAAVLDGATKIQQARYITLPHLRTVMCITLIMSLGGIFRGDFGLFYSVTKDNGRLYPVSDVIDTYIYRSLTTMSNAGMTAAAGFYQSVVGFLTLITANWVVTKIDADSAMF